MDNIISQVQLNFESTKLTAEDGMEYWSARRLMPLMGYTTWQRFSEVIDKAKEACKASSQETDVHFLAAPLKSTGGRPQENYFLTRYACYLILQNGDPRKTEVALSQTYFATQTRKQELLEQRALEDRRIEARAKLKETEKKIESTVYKRGISLPVEFATFKNKHIEALYGGVTAAELKIKRKIPTGRSLADFDSHVELKAKDFALAMTDHNINENNIQGRQAMNEEVVKNSKATRQTLLSRGIRPETLGAEEDIKKVQSRRDKEMKALGPKKPIDPSDSKLTA